jgi:hypothetical protein
MGAREGIGILEQLVIGPHAPSGFAHLLDGPFRDDYGRGAWRIAMAASLSRDSARVSRW